MERGEWPIYNGTHLTEKGQRAPCVYLSNNVQIVLKLVCTIAYRGNSVLSTHIWKIETQLYKILMIIFILGEL